VKAGLALRGEAHAVIDISDGLAGDLQHILDASKVGADVRADRLPASAEFRERAEPEQRLGLQVAGGDDYELCVCLPEASVKRVARRLDVPLTVVGKVTRKRGLRFVDAAGAAITQDLQGYRHFE
jgi:thiamine-monophosphate kinase